MKCSDNKKVTRHPAVVNRLVQRVMVSESIRSEWVKLYFIYLYCLPFLIHLSILMFKSHSGLSNKYICFVYILKQE